MAHYSEDDLVLFFYGESRHGAAIQEHLDGCAACGSVYRDLAGTLKLITAPVAPERDERYGLEVWQRIRPSLPVGPPSRAPLAWLSRGLALQLSLAALIIIAFVAGREWPRPAAVQDESAQAGIGAGAPATPDDSDRIRLAAIGDHLEQSERLLLDFVNAEGQVIDLRTEQVLAADLVDANRFYREAATSAGDDAVADVLDTLERNLIEIAHAPSTLTADQFNTLRLRLDAAALLFKVRILSEELHDREASPTILPRHRA